MICTLNKACTFTEAIISHRTGATWQWSWNQSSRDHRLFSRHCWV